MGVLESLARFNAAHPWSHNEAYTALVLRHARTVRRLGGSAAVDVGCGTGNLLAPLSSVFPQVIGIEPDDSTALIASRRFEASNTVRVDHRAFGGEAAHEYDFIVFVASLHHMPLRATLQEAMFALRPGGRIVIIGLSRETADDRLHSSISLLLNPVIGFVRNPRRTAAAPLHMSAPTASASESFDEIRKIAAEVLPGIRMRRRLFWRYSAVWTAPV